MAELRFDWDDRKAAANVAKHGISFDEAVTAFGNEGGLLLADPDHSDDEDRFILMGLSSRLLVPVVVHCYQQSDALIRIISSRKADRHERDDYVARND